MPSLDTLAANPYAKVLIIGYPGSAKTGALVSLANAGYKLRILNFDGNIAPLVNFIKPEFRKNVDVVILQDKLRGGGKRMVPDGLPTAFNDMARMLDNWKYKDPTTGDEIDLGRPKDWGADTVLVLDPLSRVGKASMRRILAMNNRSDKSARKNDWGAAMDEQEAIVEKLCSQYIRCNVVVISHLTLVGPDIDWDPDDEVKAEQAKKTVAALDYKLFPDVLGRKLPPRIAGYFDTVIKAEVVGTSHSAKRILSTKLDPDIDVKVPALDVPKELPIESGLLTIFRALTKGAEAPAPCATPDQPKEK